MLLVTNPVVRAPRSDNQDLCIPDHSQFCSQVIDNQRLWASDSIPAWIKQLRESARSEVVSAARAYSRSYTQEPLLESSMMWIMGGHQPEAFHPGVWYKNFLIDQATKSLQGSNAPAAGIHVIIDHDLPKSTSIKVPSRSNHNLDHIALETSPLPIQRRPRSGLVPEPWHNYLLDHDRIEPFVRHIESSAQLLGLPRPMVRQFFNRLEHLPKAPNAALALSQARHLTEIQHGLRNIDLPMSHVCQTQAWFRFVEHCIAHARNLWQVYNSSLDEYRKREKITNPGQPVATLGAQGPWLELPFWLYRSSEPGRNRMWIRSDSSDCILACGLRPDQFAWTLQIDPQPGGLQRALTSTSDREFCLRPRALMTTLFMRCFLADGFVHGIGGGIYDRLTDEIIRGFLGIAPPNYAIATATLHLPLPDNLRLSTQLAEAELTALKKHSQRIRSAPEKILSLNDPYERDLAGAHAGLLAAIPRRGTKKTWHRQMVDLKDQIRKAIEPSFKEHQRKLLMAQRRSQEAYLLASREYSMLLFPESNCIERLMSLASQVHA